MSRSAGASAGGVAATAEFAACRGAGRRIDRRVIARTMAVARATKPAISAISEPMGVPPLWSADTLATGLSFPVEPGATVGNRPEALPPGLAVGVGNAKPDAAMAGSVDELDGVGVPAASKVTEAVAAGLRARLAVLPVTVRLTAFRAVAVSGTLTAAWNSRCAEVASTAPRSHVDVPLPLAQPNVKVGAPAPAVADSWILASATLPPWVQAPTSHWAACPRSLVCCRGTTPTHKLTGVVVAAGAWNAVKTIRRLATPAAAVVAVEVLVGVAVGVVGDGVGVGVVSVGVGVGVDVVGAAEVGADVVGADVVGADVVGADDVDVVGVGVAVAVADALGDALTTCRGSQDSLSPGVVAAVALLVMAATTPPVAAVSRALPAIKVTALRRPCAIRVPSILIDITVKSIICREAVLLGVLRQGW